MRLRENIDAPPLSDGDMALGVELADLMAGAFPNEMNARKGLIRRRLTIMVGALVRDIRLGKIELRDDT